MLLFGGFGGFLGGGFFGGAGWETSGSGVCNRAATRRDLTDHPNTVRLRLARAMSPVACFFHG